MEKTLEFQISGCIFSKQNVTVEDLNNAFIDFCESNAWSFCGTTNLLEDSNKINNGKEHR